MWICSPRLLLLQVQEKKGQGCAWRPRQVPVSLTGLHGRVTPPWLQFYSRRDSFPSPSWLCSWGLFPTILEVLLAETLEGGAENSDPVPSPRPKAFALTTLCLEGPHLQSACVHTRAHAHGTHTRMARVLRLSSELALSAAHHLQAKVVPC